MEPGRDVLTVTEKKRDADLDALDDGWSDEEEEKSDPDLDAEAVDAGWGESEAGSEVRPRRHRTAEEKAAARKTKAQTRKQRQQARARDTAQKQKRKQRRRPQGDPAMPTRGDKPAPRTRHANEPDAKTPQPATPSSQWRWIAIAAAVVCAAAIAGAFFLR